MRLVVASASPRRAELLRAAGFVFETVVPCVDERIQLGEAPSAYVRRLAASKTAAVLNVLSGPEPIVLGADTAVVVDGEILGKPRDEFESASMLRRLSGRRHEVMTGVSLRSRSNEVGHVETTMVEFAKLSEDDLMWYVSSGEGRDKAGAYAIQGLASRFIPRIEGSYTNVVGLPIARVAELLTQVQHSSH